MGKRKFVKFDIKGGGPEGYRSCIKELREVLNIPLSHKYDVQTAPLKWVDFCLIGDGPKFITLRIDPRNLYVRGVSINGGCFWEFSDSALIRGSRYIIYPGLLFGPSGALCSCLARYDELLSSIPPFEWYSTPLSVFNLLKAISTITLPSMQMEVDQSKQQRVWVAPIASIYTIIQMTAEAARIEPIAEHIVANWTNPEPITLEMVSIQRALGFGTFSSDTTEFVGKCGSKTDYTRTLMNLEYVVVNGFDGPANIFGSVRVKGGWDEYFEIYKRDSDKSESIIAGKSITLTGYSTEIGGWDTFAIQVKLCEGEIAEGEIVFDGILNFNLHDKNLEGYVAGKHGCSVAVGYSVMEEAVMASICVMVNGHKEAHIYGTIKAHYVLETLEQSRPQILFDRSVNKSLPVMPQQYLSLTRSSIPVPFESDSDLTIVVDLWDSHNDGIASWGGELHFDPIIGTQFGSITGTDGSDVRVFITCG